MTFGDIAVAGFYMAVTLALFWKGWAWLRGRRTPPVSDALHSREEFPSQQDPPPPEAPSFSPVDGSLAKLSGRLEAGKYDVPTDERSGIVQRMREVMDLLGAAQNALRKSSPDALSIAARALANIHYVTGIAWRKHLAGMDMPYKVIENINEAFRSDARTIINATARLLAERPAPPMQKKVESYTLPCAACGADAVTYEWKDGEISFQTLSPVNSCKSVGNNSAERLRAMLENGNMRESAEFLDSTAGAGCAHYCPDCGRVYCKAHLAIETEWSGSWHTATYATCPLGHRKEFE